MADAITLTLSPASAPFVLTAASNPNVTLQLGPTLVGGLDLQGPSSIKGMSVFTASQPQANEIVAAGLAPYAYTVSEVDSSAIGLVAATAQTIYLVKRTRANVTTTIGTITFAASGTIGVVDMTAPDIAKGDLITIVAPAVQDATLSDIAFLLAE